MTRSQGHVSEEVALASVVLTVTTIANLWPPGTFPFLFFHHLEFNALTKASEEKDWTVKALRKKQQRLILVVFV